jgi:hypothetical protein
LALTPQNNEAFFREVDEDVRRDQIVGFFNRYGRAIAVLVVVGLVALAGWLWWKAHLAQAAGQDSELLAPALAPMEEGNSPTDIAALTKVAQSSRPGYHATGALALADAAAMKGDAAGAARQYQAIVDDGAVPQPIRDVALLRAVTASFDTLPPAQVIDRLKALAVPGNAWFGSAGELTALAHLKLGHKDQAAKLLAQIARDTDVPASLRGRAAGLATTLGQTIDPADTNPKG